MWNYEEFIGKAQLYFSRAEQHPRADDDVAALWLVLGLEFLLRAPLARVHPVLLADPNGDSIMHAAGYPKPGGQPKSIPNQTVIIRLQQVVPEFTKEIAADAAFLTGLRNSELHTSESPLATDSAQWLPRFTRVVDVLCAHLGLDTTEFVGAEIVSLGRALVDAADQKLQHEIARRIADAKAFFEQLKPEEIEARRAKASFQYADSARVNEVAQFLGLTLPHNVELVHCPACNEKIPLHLVAVRTTNERIEDDVIFRSVVYVAVSLSCPVCGLQLSNTAEIRAANMRQDYVREERESVYERFVNTWEPDYGND